VEYHLGFPEMIERLVHNNSLKPSPERRLHPKGVQPKKHIYEAILKDVPCIVAISQYPKRSIVHRFGVQLVERLLRPTFSSLATGDQVKVNVVFLSGQ
jgi:hypothetical protein